MERSGGTGFSELPEEVQWGGRGGEENALEAVCPGP